MTKLLTFLFIILISFESTFSSKEKQQVCHPGFIISILGGTRADYLATSTLEVDDIAPYCPGIKNSCCNQRNIQQIKEVFDTNAEKFNQFYLIISEVFKTISEMSANQFNIMANDISNLGEFRVSIENPAYLKFLKAYEHIMNHKSEITKRVNDYFNFILDSNSAFTCSLCDAISQQNVLTFENKVLTLKFKKSECEYLFKDSRLKNSFLMIIDIHYLYDFMFQVVKLLGKQLSYPKNFPSLDKMQTIGPIFDECKNSGSSLSTDCNQLCKNIEFNGKISLIELKNEILAFKIILNSILMTENKVTTDEQMQKAFNQIEKKIQFKSFFENNIDSKNNALNKIKLKTNEENGWEFTKYMNKSLLMSETYSNVWELGDGASQNGQELNRRKNKQMDDDLSFEESSQNETEASVDLKLQVMYNHSENSQLVKMVNIMQKTSKKDTDEDVVVKKNSKVFLLA